MPAVDQRSESDLAGDLALLLESAREAGRIALRYFRQSPEVWLKGGTSPVSEADYAADHFLNETLLAARPGYGWLSEERADDAARLAARRTFVVDPIDGTRGFLEGRREWCISVAVVERGRSIAGVLECPARKETFSAVLGGGAFKNGERLTVGDPRPVALVGGPARQARRIHTLARIPPGNDCRRVAGGKFRQAELARLGPRGGGPDPARGGRRPSRRVRQAPGLWRVADSARSAGRRQRRTVGDNGRDYSRKW